MKKMLEVDRAYNELLRMVMSRQLQPGYPIFDVEVAKKMGMSRTPVREAIQRLKVEGLVEVIPRKGVYIKSLSQEEIRESYELAEALEGMVAYLAAENITEEQIDNLGAITERLDESLKSNDISGWITADEEFHNEIRKISNNSIISNTLKRFDIQIHRVRIMITSNWLDKEKSNFDHKAIVEAFKKHDGELAQKIHHEHWRRIRKDILEILSSYTFVPVRP
jgi:DNA-binding GntR family transcriptional regulator